MQIDIKRLEAHIPMSFISESESDRKARIDADNGTSPLEMFLRDRTTEYSFDIQAQIKDICEFMVIEEAHCSISNPRPFTMICAKIF